MGKQERVYLTAISINAGIITLIEESGEIALYRQRGISSIPSNHRNRLMSNGQLSPQWEMFNELPKHYSIAYEDSEIMGRARASFPYTVQSHK